MMKGIESEHRKYWQRAQQYKWYIMNELNDCSAPVYGATMAGELSALK